MSKKVIIRSSVLMLLLIFTLVTLNVDFVSASSNAWIQTYGEKNNNQYQVVSLIQCDDGGYAITGSTNASGIGGVQFWLLKTDSSGVMVWNKTYGSPGSNHASCVIQTLDGGYAIVGATNASAALIKLDQEGNMQWSRTYGMDYSVSCIIQTSDGGYTLAGAATISTSNGNPYYGNTAHAFWLLKVDGSGGTSWSKTYSAQTPHGGANALIQTHDGGYAILGATENEDFLLVKTNSQGGFEWYQTYGSPDKDDGYSIVQATDGGFAMAGLMWNRSTLGGAGIVKADSAGNMLWMKNYPGFGSPSSMVGTNDGGYILCAGSSLDRIDSDGNLLWSKNISFTSSTNVTSAYLVVQASDGGYAVAGTASSVGPDGQDWTSYAWIEKTDSEGNHPTSVPEFSPLALLIPAVLVGIAAVALRKRWLQSRSASPI